MKSILVALVTLLAMSSASAGILDNTPFDRRTPVEKCQDHIADTYGGYADLLAGCSDIRTDQAVKCLKALNQKGHSISRTKIAICGHIRTDEALVAINAVVSVGFESGDMLTAASLADTKTEAACVSGLIKNASKISVKNLVSCSDDGVFAFLKRLAQVSF
ncbi:MAG: hypothetical protein OM95_11035 [Bdellovibrio sp. ArHS]|uniref:hypothetical protein n=1 Tax=Bdellovibrio sp. ArHS TaxID=1569284 RepID=UPI00058297A1|nr:hypothetical protein [Bdellovibrio sp. ArHS]KHD88051.1 MAG: hypothetical protein OM95_11035 [Bdellovibrio sp. ArHS]